MPPIILLENRYARNKTGKRGKVLRIGDANSAKIRWPSGNAWNASRSGAHKNTAQAGQQTGKATQSLLKALGVIGSSRTQSAGLLESSLSTLSAADELKLAAASKDDTLQVMDIGSLEGVDKDLQQMRKIAQFAESDTITDADRAECRQEYDYYLNDINGIGRQEDDNLRQFLGSLGQNKDLRKQLTQELADKLEQAAEQAAANQDTPDEVFSAMKNGLTAWMKFYGLDVQSDKQTADDILSFEADFDNGRLSAADAAAGLARDAVAALGGRQGASGLLSAAAQREDSWAERLGVANLKFDTPENAKAAERAIGSADRDVRREIQKLKELLNDDSSNTGDGGRAADAAGGTPAAGAAAQTALSSLKALMQKDAAQSVLAQAQSETFSTYA